MRPTFYNEIIGAVNSSNEPQYDVTPQSGTALIDATITLKNPITQPGTPQNADTMNNLFDFDNLDSMRGNTATATFSGSTCTETIKDTGTGVTNALRVTTFGTNTTTEVTTIYDDAGTTVLRQTTVTTTFSANTITEVVS